MVRSKEDVIAQFNEEVNMTVEELEAWLEDPKSKKAGTGVGIESGHKIIEILRKNPTKDPEKYDDEDLEHMRKVVGYANRHLAQEDRLKETKTREELENTKSTISLKNWGHDPVKALDEENDDAEGESTDKTEVKRAEKSDREGGDTENDNGNLTETPQPPAANGRTQEAVKESDEPAVEDNNGGSNKIGESDDVKKRKLGEDEPAAPGAEAGECDTAGGVGSADADEVEEEDEEQRPRKKSKVDGEDTA